MADIGPSPRLVPCGTCGTPVDALRAPRVRCIESEFWFFCSEDHADAFVPESTRQPTELSAFRPRREALRAPSPESIHGTPRSVTPAPPAVAAHPLPVGERSVAPAPTLPTPALPPASLPISAPTPPPPSAAPPPPSATPAPPSATFRLTTNAPAPAVSSAPPSRAPASSSLATPKEPSDAHDTLLVAIAAVSGLLSLALLLAGDSGAAHTARLVVAVAGCGVLIAHALLSRRDPRQLDRLSPLLGPVVATLVGLVARLGDHPATGIALTVAGVSITATALIALIVHRITHSIDQGRRQLVASLAVQAKRLNGGITEHCAADELRPGEEVLVEAGEIVPADGTIVAGQARVAPWLGARQVEERREGDPLVAGAHVIEGAVRLVTGWTGSDRAWIRLTNDPRRRADLLSFNARIGRLLAQRGSWAAAGLVLFTGLLLGTETLPLILSVAAVHGALAQAAIAELGAARVAKGCLDALRHGIAFHGAEHLDEASRVTITALCARGTVLLGEPEVTGIEPLDDASSEELLALAAGAESAVQHPVATAVLRAARARNVRPDATRNHNPTAGLGVTAVTSQGKTLVVGSRALMLREKISVARAEQRITELEAMGRSALLVAVDGRLVGILALQDGLRPGARAAVQHLLDAGVEPVLLSGDSRETTEAIARNIDVEHVRPELPAAERGNEVKQLSEGGAVVAVIGRSPVDDIALTAADVSIALRAAAATNADWSIGLVSDDVRDAARAIRIARRARDDARTGLALAVIPPTLAALAVAFGLFSPEIAPGAALAGALAASLRRRED